MKKENRISYRAGITRSPSDFLCEDGELAECINLVTDNEELKTVVDPAETFTETDMDGKTLMFSHRLQSVITNHIACSGNNLYYFQEGDTTLQTLGQVNGDVKSVKAIGKTLIVCSDEISYFRWNGQGYTSLGSRIPEPELRFTLVSSPSTVQEYADLPDDVIELDSTQGLGKIKTGKIEQYKDIIIGLYSKCKKTADRRKSFFAPFMVRYAVKLYDDTYTLQSNPIAVFPAVGANLSTTPYYALRRIRMQMWTSQLMFKNNTDYSSWQDIVKDVTVFVTRQTDIYDTTEEYLDGTFGSGATEATIKKLPLDALILERIIANNPTIETRAGFSGQRAESSGEYVSFQSGETDTYIQRIYNEQGGGYLDDWDLFKKREFADVLDDMKEDGVYYKLCDVGLNPTGQDIYRNLSTIFKKEVLLNIETQDQMVGSTRSEDFYSHSNLSAEIIKTYNGRLHLGDVKRSIFDGFAHFSVNGSGSLNYYEVYVRIKTGTGERVAYRDIGNTYEKIGNYIYYPDPRAYEVVIVKNHNTYCVLPLTEHPSLNGAYYITSPLENLTFTSTEPSGLSDSVSFEEIQDYIIVSETDNPFVFTASGYIHIGMGSVLGMATQTMSLGQEEHGIHPLTVFTDKGICSLKVNNEGRYMSADEVSREVCINAKSITETDGQVFFVSKKGLMFIAGREVRCVSAQMNGIPFDTADLSELDDLPSPALPWEGVITPCQGSSTFLEFIRDSRLRIAYDYTDSRLLLINPAYGFAYAYGMADGSISKVILPGSVTNVVSDYPDYLLQAGDKVYTLYGKPREDEITARKMAFMLTRPMKLAGPLTVTSLRELVNVGMWDRDGGSIVKTVVWVSDDLHSWYVRSSRFGAAARYYRIGLFIKMKPVERLSGTIVMQQERRTDNKRT